MGDNEALSSQMQIQIQLKYKYKHTNTNTQIQSILFDRGDDAVAAEEAGGVRTLEDSHQITWVATLSKNT